MLFSKVVFTVAAFAASAVAQGRIAFTSTPSSVEAGKPVTISWSGGSASPVTITLKKGDPNDLKTIAILTGDATGKSFTWTPASSLANGDDYALSISQGNGVESINYSGLIALSGGSGSTGSASGTGTIISIGKSTTAALTTITGTASMTMTSKMVLTTASAGTGTSVSRNTTFSSPTLASTATVTSAVGSASSRAASATTASAGGAPMGLQVQGGVGAAALAAALYFL